MHIVSQLPISMPEKNFAGYYKLLRDAYNLTKETNTQVTIQDVPKGVSDPQFLNYYGPRELNGQEMVRCMLQAEKRGFDAIAGACYFDTGISTVSNLLSIPVVGPAQASMNIASLIGAQFAVITTEPLWVPQLKDFILQSEYVMKSLQICPVKSLQTPMHTTIEHLFAGAYEPILEDFQARAQELIDQGADVIIAGCGLISPLFTIKSMQEIDGVPIIDPMVASLKFAEFMVRLQKINVNMNTSQGKFAHPSTEIAQNIITQFQN